MSSVDIGVELGGTKIVVAASTDAPNLLGRTRIDTEAPSGTLASIADTVRRLSEGHDDVAVGIATFGPVDLRPGSPTYGTITSTPKPGWSGVDVVSGILAGLEVPYGLDTDVNGALLGEHVHGAAGTATAAYLTVGTGIGGGVLVDGEVVHGANHPEIGHMIVPRHGEDDFAGSCPYHGGCLEGMASGTALHRRFGTRPEDLTGPDRERARDLAAWYVAHGILGLCAVVPVETVVIGGGVPHLERFHAIVTSVLGDLAAGYPPVPFAEGGPDVVPPGLGDDAGVVGSLVLAARSRGRASSGKGVGPGSG